MEPAKNPYKPVSLEDIAKNPSSLLAAKLEITGTITHLADEDKKTAEEDKTAKKYNKSIEFTLESLNGLPNVPEKIKVIAEYTRARHSRIKEWMNKKKIVVADGRLHTKLYQVTDEHTAAFVLSEAGQEADMRTFKEIPTTDTIDKYNFLATYILEKRN